MSPLAQQRPRLVLDDDDVDRSLRFGIIAGTLALIGTAAWLWPQLPDRIPSHFGISGAPDGWSDKRTLLTLPAIASGLSLLLLLLARVPHLFNYPWPITAENAERQYRLGRRLVLGLGCLLTWMLFYLFWSTAQVARGRAAGLSPWFLPLLLAAVAGQTIWYFRSASRAR